MIEKSEEAVAIMLESLLTSTLLIWAVCPLKENRIYLWTLLHTVVAYEEDPKTIMELSWLRATLLTGS